MATTTIPISEQIRKLTPVAAPASARGQVINLQEALRASVAHAGGTPSARLVGPNEEEIQLPDTVYQLLKEVVEILARGDAVTLVPVSKRLTTQQAADLLNVSRQYLVRLLERGDIQYERVGRHRRIKVEDALAYKQRRDATRRSKLTDLMQISEEAGAYDDSDE